MSTILYIKLSTSVIFSFHEHHTTTTPQTSHHTTLHHTKPHHTTPHHTTADHTTPCYTPPKQTHLIALHGQMEGTLMNQGNVFKLLFKQPAAQHPKRKAFLPFNSFARLSGGPLPYNYEVGVV